MHTVRWLILIPALLQGYLSFPENRFPVSDINPDLIRNAAMVVRTSETVIEIRSLSSETITRHYVVTILKPVANPAATLMAYYDKWSSVDRLEGTVYDAEGNVVKKFGKKDIADHSAIGDGMLYSDDRVKVIRPMVAKVPFTVEYFVETTYRKNLVYPAWTPQSTYRMSVESARLELRAKEGFLPRFKPMRLPAETSFAGDGITIVSWELKNIPAILEEPLSPMPEERFPAVYTEAAKFEIKGYTGDFTTWKSFGEWIASLKAAEDTLPRETYARIRTLTSGIDDPVERAKTVYRYMQSTCRYVSVSIGIGGVKPEDAEHVARLGYGDCKALVNYTGALLKAAGITSHYTLVMAGRDAPPLIRDFPGNQFNHVILCVPLNGDTVWLECTSMDQPFGFLGSATADRDVLIVTPDGGVLGHTPAYGMAANTRKATCLIRLEPNGDASAELTAVYSALQFEDVREMLLLSPEEKNERLRQHYDAAGMKLSDVSCSAGGSAIPCLTEQFRAIVPQYSTRSGNRMFVRFDRFFDAPGTFTRADDRKSELVLAFSYADEDTVSVELPPGFRTENLPPPATLESDFGRLTSVIRTEGNALVLHRRFELKKGRFPAQRYNDFVEFLRQVARQDKATAAIILE